VFLDLLRVFFSLMNWFLNVTRVLMYFLCENRVLGQNDTCFNFPALWWWLEFGLTDDVLSAPSNDT